MAKEKGPEGPRTENNRLCLRRQKRQRLIEFLQHGSARAASRALCSAAIADVVIAAATFIARSHTIGVHDHNSRAMCAGIGVPFHQPMTGWAPIDLEMAGTLWSLGVCPYKHCIPIKVSVAPAVAVLKPSKIAVPASVPLLLFHMPAKR